MMVCVECCQILSEAGTFIVLTSGSFCVELFGSIWIAKDTRHYNWHLSYLNLYQIQSLFRMSTLPWKKNKRRWISA